MIVAHPEPATPSSPGRHWRGALKAQVAAYSRADAPGARTEWPLHGIAQDITGHAQKIDVPLLVVAGEHDQVEPPDVLRSNLVPYLAHVDFTIIPAAGHLIPLKAPAELAQAITEFAPPAS